MKVFINKKILVFVNINNKAGILIFGFINKEKNIIRDKTININK